MDAFLLGLSNGVTCIGYCAPVLVPYLIGERQGIAAGAWIVARFLLGRLAGYIAFSLIAFAFHISLSGSPSARNVLVGSSYVVLSAFLILYGFRGRSDPPVCAARHTGHILSRVMRLWPPLAPVVLGLLTGLTLCPPFLVAFAAAVGKESLSGSIMFFTFFFCGTSVLFLPFPLIGSLKLPVILSTVGRLAAGTVGVYYLYAGLMLLLGAIR